MSETEEGLAISIIIPAFNEEQRIGKTLDQYLKKYEGMGEIIVVLNGCRDHTLDVVKEIEQDHQESLKWIDIPEAVGKGGAIIEGFKIACGKLIGFVDADGATSPEEFDRLIQQIDGFEGAIASRYTKGALVERSLKRSVIGRGFSFITRLLFWFPFKDTQCGAKIFREEVIKSVLPQLTFHDMVFDVDLLYHVLSKGFAVKEIPTVWIEEKGSSLFSSNLRFLKTSLRMLFSLVRLRIETLFPK